jgi:hypothetical protein
MCSLQIFFPLYSCLFTLLIAYFLWKSFSVQRNTICLVLLLLPVLLGLYLKKTLLGPSGHSCLITDLRKKCEVSCGFVIYDLGVLNCIYLLPNLLGVFIMKNIIFVKTFWYVLKWLYGFCSLFCQHDVSYLLIYICWIIFVPGTKSIWLWWACCTVELGLLVFCCRLSDILVLDFLFRCIIV